MVVIMKNQPAFPSLHWVAPQGHNANENPQGMTLRDYFAAKAMQALIDKEAFFDDVAESAYKVADHMLRVREA
jgi:hypothetical protein